jgi:hypothetical protein
MLLSNSAFEIGIPIATILGSGLAAYFGAFIKTKAANDANNQNFEKVLEQMKTQTAEIENIKAAISDDVWDRQKQWEIKRDAVFEALDALNEVQTSVGWLDACYSVCSGAVDPAVAEEILKRQIKAGEMVRASLIKFSRAGLRVDLMIGGGLSKELKDYLNLVVPMVEKIVTSKVPQLHKKNETINAIATQVLGAARESLGIEDAGELLFIGQRKLPLPPDL